VSCFLAGVHYNARRRRGTPTPLRSTRVSNPFPRTLREARADNSLKSDPSLYFCVLAFDVYGFLAVSRLLASSSNTPQKPRKKSEQKSSDRRVALEPADFFRCFPRGFGSVRGACKHAVNVKDTVQIDTWHWKQGENWCLMDETPDIGWCAAAPF